VWCKVREETAQTVHQRGKIATHLGHSLTADLSLALEVEVSEPALLGRAQVS